MTSAPSTSGQQQPNQTAAQAGHQQQQQSNLDNKQIGNESLTVDPLHHLDSSLFNALQNVDLDQLNEKNIGHIIPFLVQLLLNPSFTLRGKVIQLLYPHKRTNDMLQLMKSKPIEAHEVLNLPPISRFEQSQPNERIRIVAAEYLRIQDVARQANMTSQHNQSAKLQVSALFGNPLYIDHVLFCLFVLLHRPTTVPVMNLLDMSEALLHIKHGPTYIVRLVANMPDRCQEVCNSLITYGERQDEGAHSNEVSEQRSWTLRLLCQLNPSIAFTVRSVTLQVHKMPSLTMMITLDQLGKAMGRYRAVIDEQMVVDSDQAECSKSDEMISATRELEDCYDSVIAFVTGILLGVDEDTRIWFAQYTKLAQQKRIDQGQYTIMSKFRSEILSYVHQLFPLFLEDNQLESKDISIIDNKTTSSSGSSLNRKLIRATATLRLFCALRGIGLLKLNHDESETLLRLITSKPPVNQASVNFATTGVCTLLVCSVLVSNSKDEKRAADWLKWLVRESNYSDGTHSSHGKCSISELLLLIAIHFQNNQTSQIAELICATLGMKLQIKASVSKCKSLFVQEVFNEQMIAEHAIKVPVTRKLDNTIKEFLPIHCIHQLLESRSFSKHQVPIKDWILRQLCEVKKPVHHMLPRLIEAYVNSLLISTSAHGHCGTNEPLAEEDIAKVFQTRLYSLDSEGIIQTREASSEPMNTSETSADLSAGPNEIVSSIVDVEVTQVLLLYYLLIYEDIRLRKSADLSALPCLDRAKVIKYSHDFMMEVPVYYLLQLVRDNQDSFGTILPDLLKLVASQYPQLCSTQHWLTTEHYEPYRSKNIEVTENTLNISSSGSNVAQESSRNDSSSIPLGFSTASLLGLKLINGIKSKSTREVRDNLKRQLAEGFENLQGDPLALAQTISSILALPRDKIWNFVGVFMLNWSKTLDMVSEFKSEHKKLLQLTTKLWWKFNTIFPRKLWILTVNSLRRHNGHQDQSGGKRAPETNGLQYSWDELTLDPLIVLRCDSRVFRCPEILGIVLHVLGAFLAASKRCLQDHISEQPNKQKESRNLEELRTTLVLAQTSAAIQILLESCSPSDEEQAILEKRECNLELTSNEQDTIDRFDLSVNCICEHLHQVFIADTNLAKLVHFQTYSSDLLATTSDKIPSMHICLDFIPELLSQPDLTKQVFVVELTSHLCEKYAITKSLNVAKLCFNVAYTLLQLLSSDKRTLFYIPVLPALLRISKVFPILKEDSRIILNQINQITLAHMAATSSRLSLNSNKPFEGLDQMNWREVRKLMRTSLNANEALYLCIQKCLLDLDKLDELERRKNPVEQEIPRLRAAAYNQIFAYGSHVINPSKS